MDNEDFCSSVTVKRIDTTCRLTCATDIKTWCLLDVDVLIQILRDPTTDDGEVLFAFSPGVMGIDKSGSTRNKLGESDVLNFSLHQINPVLLAHFSNGHLVDRPHCCTTLQAFFGLRKVVVVRQKNLYRFYVFVPRLGIGLPRQKPP